MALSDDIVLKEGQIVVTQTSSSVVGIDVQNSPFQFGIVAVIYAFSDLYIVGDNVFYNIEDAVQFVYSDQVYYLTTEDKILFKETAPV